MKFIDFDGNKDGVVTTAEFDAFWMHRQAARHKQNVEQTQNDVPSAEESATEIKRKERLAKRHYLKVPKSQDVDANGDGIITREESRVAREAWNQKWRQITENAAQVTSVAPDHDVRN